MKKIKRFRLIPGAWILLPSLILALFSPFSARASGEQGDAVIFSYDPSTIYQEVSVDTSGKTEFIATVRAAQVESGIDKVLVGIALYGAGGGGIYFHDTGWVSLSSGGYSNITLTVDSNSVGAGWAQIASARITIGGDDGEFWAGNYGPSIESASLKIDGTELMSNVEFASGNSGWTSTAGWQACAAVSGSSPCISSTPAPTSLVVTSLADTLDPGTLRWAITQANSISGGINDSITFSNGLSGTISLASSLPAISQNLTITGPGQNLLSLDGIGLYRQFFINQNISLTISDMTLKRGPSSSGGIIYNNRGTVSATNIRFTSMSGGSAVFNNNGGAISTYTNCTWDALSIGVAGDYGSTPQLPSGTTTWSEYADSGFQNRTYINNGTFNNNWAGVYNYRFTKIQNSTFSNNTYGAHVTGLNRTQIYSSTFSTNTVGIYHSAWIPTTFNMGTDNRLIDGNTFTNNGTSIHLDDGWNNGYRNQSWSTVKNNTWDNQGTWITYSEWNGSSNTTLTASPTDTNVVFTQLSNTIPTTTTTSTTTTTTTTTIPETTTTEEQTTTTEPEADQVVPETTTTVDLPPTGTTIEETTTTTEPEPEPEPTPTTVVEPEETTEDIIDTTTTQPEESDGAESIQDTETTVPEPAPDTENEAPQDANNEVVEVTTENLEEVLSGEITPEVVDALLESIDSGEIEVTPEIVDAVTEALASGDIELTTEIVDAVVDAIESGNLSEEQIVEAVDSILEAGITEEMAETLATSPEVLAAITSEEATEIFAEISVSALTEEEAAAVVDAVQSAPEEVRESFEEEINVFGGQFDEYVPVGSAISVAERRTVVAVSVVSSVIAVSAASAPPASGGPSGGGSSGGSPSGEGGNGEKPRRRRRGG